MWRWFERWRWTNKCCRWADKSLTGFQDINYENSIEKYEPLDGRVFAHSFRIKKTFPEKASLYGSLIKPVTVIGKNWGCPTKKTKDCMTFVTKMDDEFKNFHGSLITEKTEYFWVLKAKYSFKKSKVTRNLRFYGHVLCHNDNIYQNEISEQTLHQTSVRRSYAADVIEAKLYGVCWKLQIIY